MHLVGGHRADADPTTVDFLDVDIGVVADEIMRKCRERYTRMEQPCSLQKGPILGREGGALEENTYLFRQE
jgi:hypothetical protein